MIFQFPISLSLSPPPSHIYSPQTDNWSLVIQKSPMYILAGSIIVNESLTERLYPQKSIIPFAEHNHHVQEQQ